MRYLAAVVLLLGFAGVTAAVNRTTGPAPGLRESAGTPQAPGTSAPDLAPVFDGIVTTLLKDAHVSGTEMSVVRRGASSSRISALSFRRRTALSPRL